MPYLKFNRDQLLIKKLSERGNKVNIVSDSIPVTLKPSSLSDESISLIEKTAHRIKSARKSNSSVIMAFGAHTIKNGMSPTLIALLEEGWVTHLATNGAGIIHDWEFAFQGKSSEDVKKNVDKGQFGIWEETGFYINLAIVVGAYEGSGYGESIGKMISREGLQIPEISELKDFAVNNISESPDQAASAIDLSGILQKYRINSGFLRLPHPFKKYSVQAAAFESGIPFTGHPMIGQDIIYCHPMNSGAAIGRTAINDFLSFAASVSNLENGVYLSVGSAVMSPMIFEKSLSMVQNIKIQQNKHIDNHYMLVVDLAKSDWDWQMNGEPPVDNPAYYLRFCKTFSRMGGEMHYLTADNRDFLLALYQKLNEI
ncbi:MAG: hypothetical protein A2X05_14425 [Bacteroidetes bacterium GWE2_41_25]|nr:MAG: hypothetical protein A2X03_09630 [Bacteroidetes bacterium GWA2_40_15]OFX92878.1 MAG: hypothetical protein A2X06_15770 [Bacteroidetes bacterium GWC2_40_22]OFX93602.1 MAG: hypothetical protein A2X05_14425 [Bacteroidetes bacterium GWE2_41_25]OFY58005.1 MAG: hypothetical protein A2X04_12310 [Bacteroidetes bacterium GWF2_41_9]HAM09801.1 hypothetical protein [Bacteroidales bacterium]